MEPLANLILRVTSALEDRVQQVFTGTYEQPRGGKLGKVLIGRCVQAVDAARFANHSKGDRVMVVGSNVGIHQTGYTILPAPPGNPGPASVATLRISGDSFAAPTITLSVVVNNAICGSLTPDDFVILFDGTPLAREVLTITTVGTHVLDPAINPNNDYTFAWSGDCDVDGNITLVSGQDAACTITFSDRPFAITDFFACDFLGLSGAPGDDFRNVTRDWSHAAVVHGPCLSGAYTATIVLPVTGVSFTPSGDLVSSEEPDRCAGCDPTLGAGHRMGTELVVDISVPLDTVIRISVSGPQGTAEADAYTVKGTGNPNNSGLDPCV